MILQNNSEFANVWIIVAFLSAALLMALVSAIYLHRRRRKHSRAYPQLMEAFKAALKEENIDAVVESGDKLIWNEDFSSEDRKYVFEQLNSRVKDHPELKQTWEYAHFKRFGNYPE